VFIFLLLPHIVREIGTNSKIGSAYNESVEQIENKPFQVYDQSGYITVLEYDDVITEKTIQRKVRQLNAPDQSGYRLWDWKNLPFVTATAQGTDRLHHFVNSYLVGYAPFKTDELWIPLYAITTRKTYKFDYLQYSGFMDIWQNSYEAFYYTKGDCEDHAMILADWLISMGVDARVVVGDCHGKHAWVVMIHDNKEYVLEATNKSKITNIKHYPLAQLALDYYPEFQFNRTDFWTNTGSRFTHKYTGDHWVLRSKFTSTAQKKRVDKLSR
jgi:hypothetical protein